MNTDLPTPWMTGPWKRMALSISEGAEIALMSFNMLQHSPVLCSEAWLLKVIPWWTLGHARYGPSTMQWLSDPMQKDAPFSRNTWGEENTSRKQDQSGTCEWAWGARGTLGLPRVQKKDKLLQGCCIGQDWLWHQAEAGGETPLRRTKTGVMLTSVRPPAVEAMTMQPKALAGCSQAPHGTLVGKWPADQHRQSLNQG